MSAAFGVGRSRSCGKIAAIDQVDDRMPDFLEGSDPDGSGLNDRECCE